MSKRSGFQGGDESVALNLLASTSAPPSTQ